MENMLQNLILPGQKIELQAVEKKLDSGEDASHKVYISSVYDVLTEDQFEVTMPLEQEKLILLPVDKEYDLCFYTENGLYQCFARVIDRYKSNNVYVLVMELTSNLRKYQRREYYRFSCALEMNSRKLELEEVKAVERKHTLLVPGLPLKRAIIVDISGGGLRFVANYQYEPGALIYCVYHLLIGGKNKEYNLVGKVLTSEESPRNKGTYEHRLQYINMNVDEREEIIKYIFEEERKHRRQERGM